MWAKGPDLSTTVIESVLSPGFVMMQILRGCYTASQEERLL